MGLLSRLGLKPTAAMLGKADTAPTTTGTAVAAGGNGKAPAATPSNGKAAPGAKTPEMATLMTRIQGAMAKIKALEADEAPEAVGLKQALLHAGKLATSPKGIASASALIDQTESAIVDAKKNLASTRATAAIDSAKKTESDTAKKAAAAAKQRLAALALRGRKALAADPRSNNDGWLADYVKDIDKDVANLDRDGNERLAKNIANDLDRLEKSVADFEADAKGEQRPSQKTVEDAATIAREARKTVLALADRGKKALAANARDNNAGWLADVVNGSEERIVSLEQRKTQREVDSIKEHLEWFEDNIKGMEEGAEQAAKDDAREAAEAAEAAKTKFAEPEAKPPVVESPGLKKVKAQFKQVMSTLTKLAADRNPQAAALKKAAVKAGYMATSPKGILKAARALDMVMSDAIEARATAKKAQAAAEQAKADAGKAAAETFDITVGGRKLAGLHREEAMKELRLERGKLNGQLEAGWAFHVDQMNLPNEIPFAAWLTSGVDAIKSLVPGKHRAKMPDLNIWDPARDMMNACTHAERTGDVKAFEALLPKIAVAIPKARSQVGSYKDQMEGAAQSGVDGGRFVEDTAASAIGTINEARGGSKVAAQAAAQGLFASVEQLTEWAIGTRKKLDPGAVAQKVGEEAIGAVVKEMIAGKLKPLFKSAYGSYLDKTITDAELKLMGIARDQFMTAGQKYFAEFSAKIAAGLIKSSASKLIYGKLPGSPAEMVEVITGDIFKGSGKQGIVDSVKELARLAVDAKKK